MTRERSLGVHQPAERDRALQPTEGPNHDDTGGTRQSDAYSGRLSRFAVHSRAAAR